MSAGLESETQFVEIKTRLFRQGQSLYVHVERVVSQRLQDNVGTDILHVHVVLVEEPRCGCDVVLVIPDAGTVDDQRIDVQVEWGVASSVFRGQRVEYELEIGLGQRVLSVELRTGTEKLCRGNGYFPFRQGDNVDTCREACYTQHLLLLLVEDEYVVEDDAVEETEIQTPNADLRIQFVGNDLRHFLSEILLTGGDMDKDHQQSI